MKKKLNIEDLQNELRGGSAFFPDYVRHASPPPQALPNATIPGYPETIATDRPAPTPPALAQDPQPPVIAAEQNKIDIPERVNARTPQRPNGKRIITRNSFEIYEDQMDSLRKLSFQDKMNGKLGSMSAMVREAIDTFLKEHSLEQ